MGIGAPFLDKEDTCKLDFASAVDAWLLNTLQQHVKRQI
jgi:hypothetical protein